MIKRLLRLVGRWARKPVNHTSWVAVVTPTDRPKSVRNCCLIELFCGVVCVVTLSLWHFCWYRGFCHRTGSDLPLFVFMTPTAVIFSCLAQVKPKAVTLLLLHLYPGLGYNELLGSDILLNSYINKHFTHISSVEYYVTPLSLFFVFRI